MPKSSTITEWSMTRSTGTSGLILLRIAAERLHGIAHGGEVDHGRHAGEVLHQHARRAEGDLAGRALARLQPQRHAANVVGGDGAAVLVAQQILEQNFQRKRQPADADKPVRLGLLQVEIVIAALTDFQRSPAFEAIEARFRPPMSTEDLLRHSAKFSANLATGRRHANSGKSAWPIACARRRPSHPG